MRFIKKGESPDFFEAEKVRLRLGPDSDWKKLRKPCKPRLKNYLIDEQHCLCAYCECDLSLLVTGTNKLRESHLEHLAPQSKYSDLKFSYHNLVVSCEGQLLSNQRIKKRESCGHRKANEYDESWFLNPTFEEEISEFFSFDSQDGSIHSAASSRAEHAQKMIDVLNLDAPYLKAARVNSKDVLLDYLASLEPEQSLEVLNHELTTPREFVSFLQNCFLEP